MYIGGVLDIVILDGYCLNHGDLNWDGFSSLGNVKYFDRTPYEIIPERMGNASILITNKCNIDKDLIDRLPCLKYVGVLATGYNNVDLEYAAQKGITVTNIPTYGTESVVQMVFALLLELYTSLRFHADSVNKGEWSSCPDFCYYKDGGLRELFGKTIGIIGYGRIGSRVGDVAQAFGMNVIAFDKYHSKKETVSFRYSSSLEELLSNSDVVSLNCPLTKENRNMINSESLSLMKKTAVLINTARGPLVDEKALAIALNEGIISGAALDVLSQEPPLADNPIITAKNIVITPHISWATHEARSRLMDIAVSNLKAYISGMPANKVN